MDKTLDPFTDETEYKPLSLDRMDEIVDIQDCIPKDNEQAIKRKNLCGQCWKLDRAKDWCERHNVALTFKGGGRVKVYFRCGECK